MSFFKLTAGGTTASAAGGQIDSRYVGRGQWHGDIKAGCTTAARSRCLLIATAANILDVAAVLGATCIAAAATATACACGATRLARFCLWIAARPHGGLCSPSRRYSGTVTAGG